MAVHATSGRANLLIVIHLSLPTPLITAPQLFLPSVFLLPSQNPRTAFQFSVLFPFFNSDLPLAFTSQPGGGLLIVFTENVLHTVVDLGDGTHNLFLPPRVQHFLSVLTHSMIMTTINSLFGHVAVPHK